jgi:hypothetical protein
MRAPPALEQKLYFCLLTYIIIKFKQMRIKLLRINYYSEIGQIFIDQMRLEIQKLNEFFLSQSGFSLLIISLSPHDLHYRMGFHFSCSPKWPFENTCVYFFCQIMSTRRHLRPTTLYIELIIYFLAPQSPRFS